MSENGFQDFDISFVQFTTNYEITLIICSTTWTDDKKNHPNKIKIRVIYSSAVLKFSLFHKHSLNPLSA